MCPISGCRSFFSRLKLKQRGSHSIAGSSKPCIPSLCTLTDCCDDVGQLFVAGDRDLRANSELFELINDFFKCNAHVSSLIADLRNSFEEADRGGETSVESTVVDEILEVKGLSESFRKTLKEMSNLNELSRKYAFTGDFTVLFGSSHRNLIKVSRRLNRMAKKLDKKLLKIRNRRRIVMTVFFLAIGAVIVASIGLGMTVAPPLLAIIGVLASVVPVGSLGLWLSSLWAKSLRVVKRQRNAIVSMERGICLELRDVERFSCSLKQLEELLTSMGSTGEKESSSKKKSFPLKLAAKYKNTMEKLRRQAGRCDEDANMNRQVAREKIMKYLSFEDSPSKQ